DRDPGLVDLPIDEKARDAGTLGLLHGLDRCVRSGVVENDRGRLAGNGRVDQLILLVCIVVVRKNQRLVAELLGLGGGAVRLGCKERIVVRWGDNHQQLSVARSHRTCARQHDEGYCRTTKRLDRYHCVSSLFFTRIQRPFRAIEFRLRGRAPTATIDLSSAWCDQNSQDEIARMTPKPPQTSCAAPVARSSRCSFERRRTP